MQSRVFLQFFRHSITIPKIVSARYFTPQQKPENPKFPPETQPHPPPDPKNPPEKNPPQKPVKKPPKKRHG